MSCSNCYNGCTQITSDQCVKYTGVDVPVLGIQSGDSLSYVEQALIEFLVSTLDGSGIKVTIDQAILCKVVSDNLPTCGDLTIVDVMNALIKTSCYIQTEIVAINSSITTINSAITEINGPYVQPAGCLGTLPANPTTHNVVQAIITTLCAFITNVETNYVLIEDINTYIEQYLAGQSSTSTKMYNKMVPYVAYEYYGVTDGRFTNGIGIGDWEKIYLCNGQNGTPDKRGRVAVGVTDGTMGGTTLPSTVNPASSPLNPTYTKGGNNGSNGTTLSVDQMPSHTHTPTVTVTDPGHKHGIPYNFLISGGAEGGIQGSPDWVTEANKVTDSATTGITVSVSNASAGQGQAHSNVQPGIGCLYIMYIP